MTRANTHLHTFMRQLGFAALLALGLLSTLATGGGGGGSSPPSNTAPQISNLVLSEDAVAFLAGGGRTTIEAQLDYTDPERDLANLRVEISDGSSLTIPIPAVSASSGTIVGELEFSTDTSGVFTAEVWIEDRAGNESNRLTATLTIFGSADLSSLTLAGIDLDQAFDAALTTYTATVDFNVDATTVTATTLDPAANLTVNGTAVDSGVPSGSIALAVGPNPVTVAVMADPGATSRTYTLTLTRRANARLADLTISAGDFDQIFQSGQTDYTATVGFLIPTTTVTATTEDPNATLTVNGVAVDSGTTSGKLTLDPGSNAISIVVFGVDGVTTASYTIDITRQTVSSFAQRAYIKASNTDEDDRFGWSAVLDGGTLAVGTINESSAATGVDGDQANNSAEKSGAVYVFTQDESGTWSQQAYLKATNTEMFDSFGWSLALDGDTLAVGAYWEASGAIGIDGDQGDNSAEGAGAVYVFTRNGAGDWSPQAYIKASNTDPLDHFGRSLALDGDTLVVASREGSSATGVDGDQADNDADRSGAAYVFVRDNNGVWTQQAYLKASNTESGDGFGVQLALAGNTLAVSAIGEDSSATGVDGDQADNSAELSGAVYIFTRDESDVWRQQAYVKASNTDATDNFGTSVALDGDTLVVSAYRESSSLTGGQADNDADRSGAAYVFTRDGSDVWTQQAFLKASNAESGDYFGSSLSLSGDTLVVTATDEASAAMGVGGDQADNTAFLTGAGYVFTRDAGGVWTQQAYVKASNSEIEDEFGHIVALDGDTFVISALLEDSAATGVDGDQGNGGFTVDSGAVYVFQ